MIPLLLGISTWTDLKWRIIPNIITFGLIVSGIILEHVNWGAIFISVFLYIVRFWAEGDAKLAIGLSFWLSPIRAQVMMLFYLMIVLILGIVNMIKKHSIHIKIRYPAGPVFFISYVLSYGCHFL